MRPSFLLLVLLCCISSLRADDSRCQLTFASPTLKPHFWLEEGVAKGLAVDYYQLIEENSNCTFKFVVKPWKRVLHEIKLGTVDTSIGYYNKSRAAYAHFPPHFFQRQSLYLFSRSQSLESFNIAGLQQQNKKLLYPQHWYLGQLKAQLAKTPHLALPTSNPATGLQQLVQGRADALLAPKVIALYDIIRLQLQGKVKINSQPQAAFYQYAFFSKRSVSATNMAQLDRAISMINMSGQLQTLPIKYTR